MEIFCNQWDKNSKKEILKTMEYKKSLEDPGELLNDERKYKESILEETKEYTRLVKFPYIPLMVSYDVLSLLEESYENIEGSNYWEFLGPPVYDPLRPWSIIMDPFLYLGMGRGVFPIINEAPIAF